MLVTFLCGAGVGLAVAAGVGAIAIGIVLATDWIAKMICRDPYWAEQVKPVIGLALMVAVIFILGGGLIAVEASRMPTAESTNQ